MNDTSQQQEQQQSQQPPLNAAAAYASHNHQHPLAAAVAVAASQPAHTDEEEEEQIVTSTSCDTYNIATSASAAARLPQLDTLITSPARITSSTGNDYSSSPQRVLPSRHDLTTDASSEDDSQSPRQLFASGAELELSAAYSSTSSSNSSGGRAVGVPGGVGPIERRPYVDVAMPTTSAAAAIKVSTSANEQQQQQQQIATSATGAVASAAANTTSNLSINNIRNHKIESHNSTTVNGPDMVARESNSTTSNRGETTAANSSSCSLASGGGGGLPEQIENHKIILKLPKPPAMVESHSSHSDSNANNLAEDTRKVEPLKINLHAAHHHSPSVVPKITIKPILKKQNEAASSDCSSSAEEEVLTSGPSLSLGSAPGTSSSRLDSPIPKLTIKAPHASANSGDNSGTSEPHIVPKLTIRSANEDSTIVPKLTIKINDTQTASLNNSNSAQLHSPSTAGSLNASTTNEHAPHAPPPLPKLTIKTSVDGTSESIISTISPALSSSSSTSTSSYSALSSTAANFKVTATTTSSVSATVPKLTIKKSADDVVPKLTIKTNASSGGGDDEEPSGASKIPKLTIKTGQEHAVIITQHHSNDTSNTQAIPKLTIKTKSLEVEESLSDLSEETPAPPPEKIPKITIKTNETMNEKADAVAAPKFCIKTQHHEMTASTSIPKMTISVSNLESSGAMQSPKQTSLFVRQLTCSTRKPESPERLPKLMISRQDANVTLNNSEAGAEKEKVVPKLTIKTNSLEAGESRDKCLKFAIKQNSEHKSSAYEAASEESDEYASEESSPAAAATELKQSKVVPKITIKNLSSPHKLKMKTVVTASGGEPAAKKSGSKAVSEHQVATSPKEKPAVVNDHSTLANGGESSNSQEFCGFNESTSESHKEAGEPVEPAETRRVSDDMDIDEALQQQHDPQVFNNLLHFASVSNGENLTKPPQMQQQKQQQPLVTHVVDTVDLTSSPSPGSSPAHFDYTDTEPQMSSAPSAMPKTLQQPGASSILMECLQREKSVIQQAPSATPVLDNSSYLLAQLTGGCPSNYPTPPPLQPKPQLPPQLTPHNAKHPTSNSAKYPQLTERLMANGARMNLPAAAVAAPGHGNIIAPLHTMSPLANNDLVHSRPEHVIDSIEILDSPEGSPRPMEVEENHHHEVNEEGLMEELRVENSAEILRCNNNVVELHQRLETTNHLKRHASDAATTVHLEEDVREQCIEVSAKKVRRLDSESHTMATVTIITNDHSSNATVITTSPTIIASNHCKSSPGENITASMPAATSPLKPVATDFQTAVVAPPTTAQSAAPTHRSRKQRHEHLRPIPIDEEDPLHLNSHDSTKLNSLAIETPQTVSKRRGRPKKNAVPAPPLETEEDALPLNCDDSQNTNEQTPLLDKTTKSRRVQLLRKRLAIDMVDAEPPTDSGDNALEGEEDAETPRRDRSLRTVRNSRRSLAPINTPTSEKLKPNSEPQKRKRATLSASSVVNACSMDSGMAPLNHFGGSNSSLSSACSSSSMSSTTVTTTAGAMGSLSVSGATQIDLTMSSCSSVSNSSAIATVVTTVTASASSSQQQHNRNSNSMLPPTMILSSSDPVPDVIFKPNDFSSLMATQQLRAQDATFSSMEMFQNDDEEMGSGADNSGDDSTTSSTSQPTTPSGRGRGRGRGRGGGRGAASARGPRAHRLGRGASAVAKAIAMSRPRCVGGLKHQPDPERLKGLFSPLPQVFEEDTRMSADLNTTQTEPPPPIRQPDFITNEESQSSVVSTSSILDPNNVVAVQNGSAVKRPKKKKMEVCVADDTEFTVASIAEYDWPPPKGCCPSKNRDTFMIQEQVALYLGIKSFKRKYPDLPRRQIDMEERNWLQEKALVSEKMCDLGITAVWASDILDIMYTDFYDKYEEYKDFIRQKHLREIEAKQKALGLNVTGRGLQARDRAMLSASKWNSYFNRSRKEERVSCLDLQTLTVNVPAPADAPIATLINRPVADAVAASIHASRIAEPPTLLRARVTEPARLPEQSYPLALVPGQYCMQYRHYTPQELRCYPLNTVLDDPSTLYARLRADAAALAKAAALEQSTGLNDVDNAIVSIAPKRVPIRRSRRARTEAALNAKLTQNQTTTNECGDIVKTEEGVLVKSAIASCSGSDTEASSSDDDSASETDSDSESSSSSEANSSSDEEDEEPSRCGVCQRVQNRNLKDTPEVFIRCYTCRRKVHPSCIEMPHRMSMRVRNYNWQCADCKCCIKCKRKQDQNKMLFCEQCDRGFHIYCLGLKTVPDCRWSCERCSVCMRCGATKPEGLPQLQQNLISPNGERIKQIKHKKVKWINEYRIDHITKLREHCSMLCVPCARAKTTKRVQIANATSGCSSNSTNMPSPPIQQSQMKVTSGLTQMSPPAAPLSAAPQTTTIMHPPHSSGGVAASTISGVTNTAAVVGSLPPPPVVA